MDSLLSPLKTNPEESPAMIRCNAASFFPGSL
jgi:hypothetical protein